MGECKYARQVDGRGQYGHVKIRLYPGVPGSGFIFQNDVVGGAIPVEFIRPIELGCRYAAKLGTPECEGIVDVRVVLEDGSYHDVDSTEFAFVMAGELAFRDAVRQAGPVEDSSDGDGASFVPEPRSPRLTPRNSAIALPEPDDDDYAH